jgi:hypothetical protein
MRREDGTRPRLPLKRYGSLASFYMADPRRVHSRELDVGLWWREDVEGPLHRAAWVRDTGELYLVRLGPPEEGGGRVEVLARVADHERLERMLKGWRERCGQPRSLTWLRERGAHALRERGYRVSPSSGSASQDTAESANWRYSGRIAGSRSSVPSRTATS